MEVGALSVHIIDGEVRVENASEASIAAFDAASWPQRQRSGQPPRSRATSFSQCIREGSAGGVHLVQNVVGGAVHNAQNAGHTVTSQESRRGRRIDSTRNRSLVGELSTRRISGSLRKAAHEKRQLGLFP